MQTLVLSARDAQARAAADSLADVFAQMDKAAASFKGMSADVKNDTYIAMVKDHDIQQGTIKLKRGKKDTSMLIDFTGPEAQTISLDGGQLRVYYPKTKQVQVWDVANKAGLIDQFLLLGFGATSAEIKRSYDVTYRRRGDGRRAACGAHQAGSEIAGVLKQLKQAELWISDSTGLPVQQKFVTSRRGRLQAGHILEYEDRIPCLPTRICN